MKVLTSKQMKEIDRAAIEEIGILGPILMENAGLQIVKRLREKFPNVRNEKVVILAGKGNNGGDGFVVARHLYNEGSDPCVLLLASKGEVKGDAAVNLKIADKIGIKMSTIQSQVKKRIIEPLRVPGFTSLVKSSELLKEVMRKLRLIEIPSELQ